MGVTWGIGVNGRNFTFVYLTWTGLMFVSHKSYACLVCNFSNGLNLIHAWNLLSSPFLPAHPPVQFKTQLYAKNNFVYFDTYKSKIIGRLQKEVLHKFVESCTVVIVSLISEQKSDNLQYNTLGRWDDRLIDQASDHLLFQVLFFHNFLQNSLQKSFPFIFS